MGDPNVRNRGSHDGFSQPQKNVMTDTRVLIGQSTNCTFPAFSHQRERFSII